MYSQDSLKVEEEDTKGESVKQRPDSERKTERSLFLALKTEEGGPQAKKCECPLEARKIPSTQSLRKRAQSQQQFRFNPVRPVSNICPTKPYDNKFYCLYF